MPPCEPAMPLEICRPDPIFIVQSTGVLDQVFTVGVQVGKMPGKLREFRADLLAPPYQAVGQI